MQKAQILVVDDEEDIQELVTYNLTKEGYRVTGAGSGEDAQVLHDAAASGVTSLSLTTAWLDVSASDIVRLFVYQSSGGALNLASGSFMELEIR